MRRAECAVAVACCSSALRGAGEVARGVRDVPDGDAVHQLAARRELHRPGDRQRRRQSLQLHTGQLQGRGGRRVRGGVGGGVFVMSDVGVQAVARQRCEVERNDF